MERLELVFTFQYVPIKLYNSSRYLTFHLDLHSDMSLFKFSTADVAYFAKGIYIPIYLYLNRNYGI